MDDEPRDEARLEGLACVGKTLQAVLKAARAAPGTVTHGEAWLAAERVTKELRGLAGETTLLGPIVDATAKRVSRNAGSMV